MTNKMTSVNDNIQYVSIKKNIKYPINGRQHTYEDIYNMYKTSDTGINIPYHTINNNVEDYNTTNNTLENTSTYTDIKALNTEKHKLVFNTSTYTHDNTTNRDSANNVTENYFHNNVDSNLPNNIYNSELYYDISTFVHIPQGLGLIEGINTLQGDVTNNKPMSKSTNLTLNTSVPDDIYQQFIDIGKGLNENDIFLISRSNIKYPEFKVDINELKFSTNNIDILPSTDPSVNGEIFNIKTFNNSEVEDNTRNVEQYSLVHQVDNLEVYKAIFNNQYYTIMRLTYNNIMFDRIRKYKINIHVPNNNYDIPLEFIKLSNIIFARWKFSYTVQFNSNTYSLINYGGHKKNIRDNNYNNGTTILPPITPISMGILPHTRAGGLYPTNAYHYVYASTWAPRKPATHSGQPKEKLIDLVKESIAHTKQNGFLESCCRYNDGFNMPWEVKPQSNSNSVEVVFTFRSMLYEYPTKFCNTGNNNTIGEHFKKISNIQSNIPAAYKHNIMFFMSFARFIKDNTGSQIFQGNSTVKDIPVTLELTLSFNDAALEETSVHKNYVITNSVVKANSIINNNYSIEQRPLNYTLNLTFPGENNQDGRVQCSPVPPSVNTSTAIAGVPVYNRYTKPYSSINITGRYGTFQTGLNEDLYPQNYDSNIVQATKALSEFNWEPNADAILSPRAKLGCNVFSNYIYNLLNNNKVIMSWLSRTPIQVTTPDVYGDQTLWNDKKKHYTKYVNTLTNLNKSYYYDSYYNYRYMTRYFMSGYDNDFITTIKANNYSDIRDMHCFTFDATLYELIEPDLSWLLSMFPVN